MIQQINKLGACVAGLLLLTQGLVFGQTFQKTLQEFMQANQQKQRWATEDISEWRISSQYTDQHNGVTHIYIQQQYQGIDVKNSVANFSLDKNGKVINMGERLQRNIARQAQPCPQPLSPDKAILAAIEQLNLSASNGQKPQPKLLEVVRKDEFVFDNAQVSSRNIPVKLVYQPIGEGQMRLAWDLSIEYAKTADYWSVRVDAADGKIIHKANWSQKCAFHQHAFSKCKHLHQQEEDLGKSNTLNSQYRIFPLPIESPNHGSRALVVNPANTLASPYGWHDINGAMGAEFTNTRGNNVYAYEDVNADDNPGLSPDGGASLVFDFPLNLNQNPSGYQDAAITNLFYMNNMMHDIFYQYGFNENSGNFQTNNYGRGGLDNDHVFAEAQDGSGTNNANFATPDDGQNGRMQMFLWSNNTTGPSNLLTVNSPSVVAGAKTAVEAGFGGQLPSSPLTANVVLMVDNTAPINDGCETITNASALNGRIALVDRGTCGFTNKVFAAQQAGAVAVIVINNVAVAPFAMGGSNNSITIPSVMISQTDGNALKTQLNNGQQINATLMASATGSFDLDADFDNGIIAHEYGHGISTRLAGGPMNSNCLQNAEQMGEGWSDWFALMLTQEPGDAATDARGMGTYAFSEPTTGGGIRNSPYSTDMNVNAYTYGNTNDANDLTEPHGIGFVWATMLWDLNWALVNRYGFDPNLYTGTGGNNIALQLVIDGLKLQPCDPGFIDGRDAILRADSINYNGANQCLIWEVFARRGLGANASQGSSSSRTDQTEDFSLPTQCQVPVTAPTANFSSPALSSCNGRFSFVDASTNVPQAWSWNFGDGNSSSQRNPTHTYTSNGTYTVILTTSNSLGSDTASLTVQVQLPAAPNGVNNPTICAGETATLTATGSNLNTVIWYDANGNQVATGNPFVTPNISSNSSYFVANGQTFPIQNVGPSSNSFGTGGNHNTNFIGTVNFTANEELTMVSTLVYAASAGVRTINLWDDINGNGNIIQSVQVNIPNGQSRVQLNFRIPAAGNYSIGGDGQPMNLYRNNTGASYPYSIAGLISLTGSSAGTDFYYYFYDIEVQKAACTSARIPATVFVEGNSFSYLANGLNVSFSSAGNGTGLVWDFGDGSSSTVSNPSHSYSQAGTYTVTLSSNNGQCSYSLPISITPSGLSQSNGDGWNAQLQPNPASSSSQLVFSQPIGKNLALTVYAADGKKVYENILNAGTSQYSLSVAQLPAGIYWVRVESMPQPLKLVVEKR